MPVHGGCLTLHTIAQIGSEFSEDAFLNRTFRAKPADNAGDSENGVMASPSSHTVQGNRMAQQPSCSDHDTSECSSPHDLLSDHSKYSLEQRKIRRTQSRSAQHKDEPKSKSTLPPECSWSDHQDSTQQTTSGPSPSKVTPIRRQCRSPDSSVEAIFEDLFRSGEVASPSSSRGLATRPADIQEAQTTCITAMESAMLNAHNQAYYPSDHTLADTQGVYYYPYYIPTASSDHYTAGASDGYWIQPQYAPYTLAAPYSEELHDSQGREDIGGPDEYGMWDVSPEGVEVDSIRTPVSRAQPQFEWRPHRLY